MIEGIITILIGTFLIYKSITRNESYLKFGISVDNNLYLFKFLNFSTGLLLLAIGIGMLLKIK
jgi:hypothetical protein